MAHAKIIKSQYAGSKYDVVVLIDDCDEEVKWKVKLQSLVQKKDDSYFLIEEVKFDNVEAASDFVKAFSDVQAANFLRRAYNSTVPD